MQNKIKFTAINSAKDGDDVVLYGLDERGRVWFSRTPYPGNGSEAWQLIDMPDNDAKPPHWANASEI